MYLSYWTMLYIMGFFMGEKLFLHIMGFYM